MGRKEVSKKVKAYLRDRGSLEPVKGKTVEEMDLINDVGLDSIDVMELQVWMEKTFSIKVEYLEFYSTVQTVGDVVDFVWKRQSNS